MARRDKKDKKDKKDRKDKKRKRERSDSSGSEDEGRAHRRLAKEADRLTKALQKGSGEAYATDQGELRVDGRFVWKKKIEKELQEGARTKDIYERERGHTEAERRAEVEKVQRRREDREQERQQREREQEELARDRAAADAMELEKKEDEFHLENAKARARARLREGREKPIDLLARDLLLGDEFDVGPEPPHTVLEGLDLPAVTELKEDIMEYQELDSKDEEHAAWWEALLTVCDDELAEASRQDERDRARPRAGPAPDARRQREVGLHSSVDAEIHELLAGQSYGELTAMEGDLREQLESGTAPDPEFHSAVLRRLHLHKARARLRELHRTLRARSAATRDSRVDVPAEMGWRDERADGATAAHEREQSPAARALAAAAAAAPEIEDRRAADEAGHAGQWSPEPLEPEEYAGRDVVSEEGDERELRGLRAEVQQRAAADFGVTSNGAGAGQRGVMPRRQPDADAAEPTEDAETRQFRALAARSMGDIDEARDAPFGGEVRLESRLYWWHDKHRPRKPKYFNRVHTGYEWNKYNQTHYDHDNPPPKVVQGYKFNVFYPDLIAKKTSPEYSVEADPEADEFGSTCILRFHAGPPYEDLTFRILNKEWEYSHKKGYKCVFDRDTLYLYFNFKRQRYRR